MKFIHIMFLALAGLVIFSGSLRADAATPDGAGTGVFAGIDVDSLARSLCRGNAVGNPCGIWRATVDGATVALMPAHLWQKSGGENIPAKHRNHTGQWVIVLLDNPSPGLQPGTLMGWFSDSAKPGHYNAMIYTRRAGSQLTSPKKFTLRLADESHLTMTAIHRGVSVNPFRLLPYMIRGFLRWHDDTPRDLDGFIREWPVPENPAVPRFL